MSELSPEAKALFKEARTGFEPSSRQKGRVYGAIVGSAVPAIATATASSKLGVTAGVTAATWIKVVGISVLVGSAGMSVALLARDPRVTTPVVEPASSAMAAASRFPELPKTDEVSPATDEALQPSPAKAPIPMATRPRAPREAASDTDTLESEVREMNDARQALQEGRPELALSLASAYASRYPRGVLREEELAIRVLALCRLGRTAEATAVADRLEKTAPRSPQLARIRMSCVSKTAPKP